MLVVKTFLESYKTSHVDQGTALSKRSATVCLKVGEVYADVQRKLTENSCFYLRVRLLENIKIA